MSNQKINIKIYNDVVRVRGARVFDAGTLFMRMFQYMFTLGTVSMMTLAGYSAFIAGTVTAVLSISIFLIGPRVSKQIDAHGQSKIVPIVATICCMGLCGLLATVALHGPLLLCYLFSILIGFNPNAGAMARTRWAYIIHTNKFGAENIEIRTAYAYEGIIDDIGFMFSPALAIALNSLIHPIAGMALGGILFAAGSIILVSAKATEPVPGWKPEDNPTTTNVDEAKEALKHFYLPDSKWVTQSNRSVIFLSRTVLVAFLTYAMVGIIFGSYDSSVVLICQNLNAPTYASFIMSYSGVISAVAGFVFGTIAFKIPMHRMFIITAILYAATYCSNAAVSDLLTLFIFITIASPFYAPFLITTNSAIERAVPGERLTEGITWMNAGLTIGFAIGPTAAGALMDAFGVTYGLILTATGCVCLTLIVLLSRKALEAELD